MSSSVNNTDTSRDSRPAISINPPTSSGRVTPQPATVASGTPLFCEPLGETADATVQLVQAVEEHHRAETHLAITGTAPPAVVVSFSNIAPSAGLGTGRAER
jgi:hypothetical protein